MGTAHHPPPSLLFARAVLAGHETQVTRHLRRATGARGVIERGDIRRRGDGPNARHGGQAGDDRVLGRDPRKPVVRGRELVVQNRDQALQRRERLGDR
jgi:hypothetical protein